MVGLGFAGRTALEAFSELPDVEVVALAGLEKDILAELGEKHRVPHLYEKWEDLLQDGGLDAVSIGTPTQLHAPIALAALEQGLHVLCEKPLARTVDEGEQMVAASKKAGKVLKVIFNHRERGDVRGAEAPDRRGPARPDLLRQGALDAPQRHPRHGRLVHQQGTVRRWPADRPRRAHPRPGAAPDGRAGDHHRHARTPSPSSARAAGAVRAARLEPTVGTLGSKFEVEDLATAYLRLEGGGALQLETSWATYRAPGDNFGIELFGTEGGAKIEVQNYTDEDTLRIFTDVGGVPAEVRPATGAGLGHRAVVSEFVAIVRAGDWTPTTARRPAPDPDHRRLLRLGEGGTRGCAQWLNVTVWGENVHDQRDASVQKIYPDTMHETIAAASGRSSATT